MKNNHRHHISSFFIKQKQGGFGFWYLLYENEDGSIEPYSGPHTYKESIKALRIACIQHGHETPDFAKTKKEKISNFINGLFA